MSFFNITFVYVMFKWFRYYYLSASVNLSPFVTIIIVLSVHGFRHYISSMVIYLLNTTSD